MQLETVSTRQVRHKLRHSTRDANGTGQMVGHPQVIHISENRFGVETRWMAGRHSAN